MGECAQILEDLILEIDKLAEEQRSERELCTQTSKDLQDAVDIIRSQAVLATISDTATLNGKTVEIERNVTDTPNRKCCRMQLHDSNDKNTEFIPTHLEFCNAAEKERAFVHMMRLESEKPESERRHFVEKQKTEIEERCV